MEDAAHEETGMIKVDHQRAGVIRDVIMKDEVNLIRDVYEEHEDDEEMLNPSAVTIVPGLLFIRLNR